MNKNKNQAIKCFKFIDMIYKNLKKVTSILIVSKTTIKLIYKKQFFNLVIKIQSEWGKISCNKKLIIV